MAAGSCDFQLQEEGSLFPSVVLQALKRHTAQGTGQKEVLQGLA